MNVLSPLRYALGDDRRRLPKQESEQSSSGTLLANHFVHPDIIFVYGNAWQSLESETKSYLVGVGQLGEQSVVVPFATSESVALTVECHTWNYCHVNILIVGEEFTYRFHDVEETALQVLRAAVGAQFHVGVVDDSRQEHRLTVGNELVDDVVSVHFVGQRIVHEDDAGVFHTRVNHQASDNRKRQFPELFARELSLLHSDVVA